MKDENECSKDKVQKVSAAWVTNEKIVDESNNWSDAEGLPAIKWPTKFITFLSDWMNIGGKIVLYWQECSCIVWCSNP